MDLVQGLKETQKRLDRDIFRARAEIMYQSGLSTWSNTLICWGFWLYNSNFFNANLIQLVLFPFFFRKYFLDSLSDFWRLSPPVAPKNHPKILCFSNISNGNQHPRSGFCYFFGCVAGSLASANWGSQFEEAEHQPVHHLQHVNRMACYFSVDELISVTVPLAKIFF